MEKKQKYRQLEEKISAIQKENFNLLEGLGKSIFEQFNEGVILIHKSKIEFANSVSRQMLGISKEILTKSEFIGRICKADQLPFKLQLNNSGEINEGIYRFCIDKTNFQLFKIAISDITWQGKSCKLLTLSTISDNNQLEYKHVTTGFNTTKVLTSTSSWYWEWNTKTNKLVTNFPDEVLRNYNSDIFLDDLVNYLDKIDVTLSKPLLQNLDKLKNGKATSLKNILQFIDENKSAKCFLITGYIIKTNKTGNALLISGSVTDITMLYSHYLEESSELYLLKMVAANSRIGIWDYNISQEKLSLNPELKGLCGYRNKKINSFKFWSSLIHKEDKIWVNNETRDFINGKIKKFNLTFRIIHKKGHVKWFLIKGFADRDERGKAFRIYGTCIDITGIKNLSEKEIENKAAMLANISHEIRTPLNSIIGFSKLLREHNVEAIKQKEYLSIINECSNVLLNLVKDLLIYSKIEAGVLEINKNQVNLEEFLCHLELKANEIMQRLDKTHLSVKLSIPKSRSGYRILTDESRLDQVFTNLIYNSIKFTKKGGLEIGYLLKKSYVHFYVKDTGSGIPKAKLSTIFKRYEKLSNKSENIEGTGLGLAICRDLIVQMGGSIWAESQYRKGSTFYFTIPYSKPKEFSLPTNNRYKPVSNQTPVWPGKTLLLVEDDEASYQYIKEVLENTGIKLIHTKTAEEAIEICKKDNKISIVLMDIRLPGMQGFEASSIIKDINHSLPVIAQTAYAMSDDKDKCLSSGCDDYLSKPIDRKKLIDCLVKYIEK